MSGFPLLHFAIFTAEPITLAGSTKKKKNRIKFLSIQPSFSLPACTYQRLIGIAISWESNHSRHRTLMLFESRLPMTAIPVQNSTLQPVSNTTGVFKTYADSPVFSDIAAFRILPNSDNSFLCTTFFFLFYSGGMEFLCPLAVFKQRPKILLFTKHLKKFCYSTNFNKLLTGFFFFITILFL